MQSLPANTSIIAKAKLRRFAEDARSTRFGHFVSHNWQGLMIVWASIKITVGLITMVYGSFLAGLALTLYSTFPIIAIFIYRTLSEEETILGEVPSPIRKGHLVEL